MERDIYNIAPLPSLEDPTIWISSSPKDYGQYLQQRGKQKYNRRKNKNRK